MSKKFFSLFLSALLTASVVFAIMTVAKIVVDNNTSYTAPEKISDIGGWSKHYYDSLSIEQQHTYNEILKKIYDMPQKIKIPSIESNDLDAVFTALFDDNPDLYFVKGYRDIQNYGLKTYCVMDYAMTNAEYVEAEKKIEEVCQSFVSSLSSPDDEWQTELEINDFIVDNCEYKFDKENGWTYSTAYSVLINGVAACEGYSKAAKMLFDETKIESMVVRGTGVSNDEPVDHMWNVVKINDEYYNFDCTWNDPICSDTPKEILSPIEKIKDCEKRYVYFNLSDEMIKNTHIPERKLVNCTATEGYYFNKTVELFDDYNDETEAKILSLVGNAIENGKESVSVCFSCEEDFDDAVDSLGVMGKVNDFFEEYENVIEIKNHAVYSADKEKKITIVIEYA